MNPTRSILSTLLLMPVVAIVGCDGHSTAITQAPLPATTSIAPNPTSAINYGRTYLDLVAPVNAGVGAYDGTAASAKALTATFDTFDSRMLRVAWPANVDADVKTLVRDDGAIESDLTNGNTDAATSHDFNLSANDANVVRADLGLPPAQS